MNEQTKQALIDWTELVSTAIARQAVGKYVDWYQVLDAQEVLRTALESEKPPPTP